MCQTYNSKGQPSYVRACYRTGQRGLRVPVEHAVWGENGHLLIGTTDRRDLTTPDGQMLHFRTGLANPVGEADMARYAHARSAAVTELGDKRYISLHVDRASPNIVRRAQSFGWKHVAWFEGLPLAPTKQAKARKPRRSIEAWYLIVMFDRKLTDDEQTQLAELLDDDPARRWWKHTVLDTWQLNVWRNQGWTRAELREAWYQIEQLGGREYRQGDDPHIKSWEDIYSTST